MSNFFFIAKKLIFSKICLLIQINIKTVSKNYKNGVKLNKNIFFSIYDRLCSKMFKNVQKCSLLTKFRS
jgi:hypothetical protein